MFYARAREVERLSVGMRRLLESFFLFLFLFVFVFQSGTRVVYLYVGDLKLYEYSYVS